MCRVFCIFTLNSIFTLQSLVTFEWSPEEFHERLSVCSLDNIDDVEKYYAKNFETISGQYGVLLFMYTVFLTKVK